MAHLKSGLDYFPFVVDFFSDKKIKRLRARYGNDGVMVYIFILCEIYRNGYYIDYDDDLILDISDDLNITENATRQIVNYLLSRSLFDDKLAKSVKVLTAKSIQLRYQEIVEGRAKKRTDKCIEVEGKFWVLNEEETRSFIKVRHFDRPHRKKDDFPGNNSGFPEKNDTKESKVKQSKVKQSKVVVCADDSTVSTNSTTVEFGTVKLTQQQHSKLVEDFGSEKVEEYIKRCDEYQQSKGRQYSNNYDTIRKWIEEDKAKEQRNSDGFDPEKYKCLINQI